MSESRDDQSFHRALEHLEQRKLLSASFDGGSLELRGTPGDDAIIIQATEFEGQIRVSGVQGVEDGAVFEDVRRVRLRLGQGNDTADVSGLFLNDRGKLTPFRIEGGEGDDVITGGDSRNRLLGGAGNDTLTGGERADIIRGRKGNDVIDGRGGADKLRGDDGIDTILGGSGNDELKGGRGDDSLHGEDGHDRVSGGAGDDSIHGGSGDDWMNGNSGSDDLFGDEGQDDFRGRNDEARDRDDDDSNSSDDDDSDDRGGGNNDDSNDSSDDDGTDDRGGGNDDDSNDGSDDDGTDDRGGDNNDDRGGNNDHRGFDDDFVFLLRRLESGLGALPQEMIDLVEAARALNNVAGPAMHAADRDIKNLFNDDRLEFLVADDPPEGAGDAIVEALERLFGGDDGVRDFDRDGAMLDFDDIITAYDVLQAELPDGVGNSIARARGILAQSTDLTSAVQEAFERLQSADLGDAFWRIVRSSTS